MVLQDHNEQPREAKPREVVHYDLKTPREGFLGHREPKKFMQQVKIRFERPEMRIVSLR